MDEESITPEETSNPFGPREVSLLTLLLRTLGALGGGIIGTGMIVVIALLGASILQSALGTSTSLAMHPLFVFVFMAMIFLGSASSNLLGPLFMGLADRDHYKRIATSLYQIFIANLVILIVIAPVYMIVSGLNVQMIASVAAMQVIVSAFASALILEIIADYRYALLGVYSTAFAVLVSGGIYFLFYTFSSGEPIILLFMALPVIWFSIGLFGSLLSFVYGWIYKLYGVDFLSSVTVYGEDERSLSDEEEAAIEEEHEANAVDSGAKFLEHTDQDKNVPS